MIDLDSDRWAGLDHAYGDASDLPPLLRRLAAGDGSVMNDIFGSVCHQGSIYGASYAAVPHLVAAARSVTEVALRAEILIVVGSIRSSRDDRSHSRPTADVQRAYEESIPEALALALATLPAPMEPYTAVYLLQAAAALKGYATLGRVLSGFLDEEFCLTCRGCGRDLYVWPDDAGLSVAAEDPVSVPGAKRTQVSLGPAAGSPAAPAFGWLTQVGGSSALQEIGARLPFLFGMATCPSCGRAFVLVEELEE